MAHILVMECRLVALRDILHRHSSSVADGGERNRQIDIYRAVQEALVDTGCCAGMFKSVQGGG